MNYSYIWDGGSYDFPDPPDYSPADDEWDEFVIEVESMQAHYADEINGDIRHLTVSGIAQIFDMPEDAAEQLSLFGNALR